MRTRLLVLVFAALLFSVARASAQTSAPAVPSAVMSPPSGDIFTAHEFQIRGVAPGSDVLIVLFDPAEHQTIMHAATDATGAAQVTFAPTEASWQLGLYRAVAAVGGGNSISATFTVGDGGRHLMVGPDLPSPNSAIEVSGTGLPPASEIRLILTIAGGLGTRDVSARTDTQGTLTSLVWPQALGFDFFSAGRYEVAAPDLGLDASFFIREHPSTSSITLDDPIMPGNSIPLRLKEYTAGRYVWVVYATDSGQPAGEFLLGPIDGRGEATTTVQFPTLAAGRYLLATPYDWGETTFSVAAPTRTSTPTETVTPTLTSTATPTLTPTSIDTRTATPQRTATSHKTCKRTKGRKKRCRA